MLKASRHVLLISLFFWQACSRPPKHPNRAYQWGRISLECTANDTENFKPRPTITSRILGLTWVAIFDAWSRYDDKAVPLYLNNVERRPASERNIENKEITISYAAYRIMLHYYFSDSTLLRREMITMGLDPENYSLDPATPEGIGNLAAKHVIDGRRNDGANEIGNQSGGDGSPYADYTGYFPVNDPDNLHDIAKWQPKYFSDGKGGQFAPPCLTPQWSRVTPLALDSASQFRPGPPPGLGTQQLAKEVKEVIELQANLTDQQRGLVEFMRDGPKSVQQAGHWLIFAQSVSQRDRHTLDEDVKMYFLVEMGAMDAFIACWDSKMFYDFARPYTLVHDYYQNELIQAWGGPDKGMVKMKGTQWRPYSPDTFLCPPFPSYVSGHSTVSAACGELLRRFTGSDDFNVTVKVLPGVLTEPHNTGDTVAITFPTFTQAADMAGFSRVLGGYHIQSDNLEGLRLGRHVADAAWKKYISHVTGSKSFDGNR